MFVDDTTRPPLYQPPRKGSAELYPTSSSPSKTPTSSTPVSTKKRKSVDSKRVSSAKVPSKVLTPAYLAYCQALKAFLRKTKINIVTYAGQITICSFHVHHLKDTNANRNYPFDYRCLFNGTVYMEFLVCLTFAKCMLYFHYLIHL